MTDTLPVTLLLVRHGRTAWNHQRRVLGRTDIDLDEVGLAQRSALPARLGPVDAVWSSPLTRARRTAESLGLPVREAPGLTEMDQGELEGLHAEEMVARFGELIARWRADPSGLRLPGGETMEEVQARAMDALDAISAAHRPGERVAVVTHQLVLAAVCAALAESPLSSWQSFTHDNCCWAVVEARPSLRLTAIRQGTSPPPG